MKTNTALSRNGYASSNSKHKHMKNTIILSILLLLANTSLFAQEGFKIAGRLGGTLGGKLLLVTIGTEGAVKLDETEMTNGNFEFTGKVDAMTPAYILTEERKPIASLMLENTEFAIVAGQEGIEVEGGGEAQKIWNRYEAITRLVSREKMKMEQEAQQAYAQQNQMKLQAIQQQYLKVAEEAGTQQSALFKTYKDSPVTAFMIFTVMQQADYEYLKELYDGPGETAKNRVYVRSKPEPGARTAVTHYRTVASAGGLSLVECRLGTGRTHQIRAQMAAAGTPLLGDGKYGDGKRNRALGEEGQLLYSYRVDFGFTSGAGALNYLKGASFRVPDVGFVDKYFPGIKF